MLPIFSMELGLSPIIRVPSSASVSHPPTPLRSRLCRKYLGERGVRTDVFEPIWSTYAEDQKQKTAALGDKEKKAREQDEKFLDYVFNKVEPALQAKVDSLRLKPFTAEDLSRAEVLKDRLATNEPIPAYRKISDENIRARLTAAKAESATRQDVYQSLQALDEHPASSSEILSAGWLHKVATQTDALKKVFEDGGARFDHYANYLMQIDRLLLKSLRLSSVHTELVKHASV